MLNIREKGILLGIIKHCHRAETKIRGVPFEAFMANDGIKEIVCFNVLQIGELAKNLSPDFLKQYPKMPWKEIKGMRDWVAHGYGTIHFGEVYQTATCDLKPLREYCEQIIEENE